MSAPEKRTRKLGHEVRVSVKRYRLAVVSGPDKGVGAELEGRPLVAGTDPACELVLTDETVSSRHCEFSLSGGRVLVRDLDSTNGVLVEKVQVREAFCEPGAHVMIGRDRLAVKSDGEVDVSLLDEDRFERVYGRSQAMRALFVQLGACAKSDAPLLIEGETGTGKNVVAEAVHQAGPRVEGPLVVFDCGAVAPTLLEAELFGYEKGAFTGAEQTRPGLAERAHEGTLVIDELGELPLALQPKLLRLLEQKEVRRLGSGQTRQVDVRIIACTNRTLAQEVRKERFREDLFFRISALRLRVPSLRERLEDIPGLVDQFLRQAGSALRFAGLPESERVMLMSHRWPGNVRELRNVVERLVVFPADAMRQLIELRPDTATPTDRGEALPALADARERAAEDFERRYLAKALARAQGSISEAARQAGVSRQFIQKLMRKHGLR